MADTQRLLSYDDGQQTRVYTDHGDGTATIVAVYAGYPGDFTTQTTSEAAEMDLAFYITLGFVEIPFAE